MTARLDRQAVGCWLAWLAGAMLARTFGIWVGIGGTAVAVALVMLVQAWSVLRPLLVPSPVALAWGGAAAVMMIATTDLLYAVDRAGPAWTTAGTAALYRLMHAGAPPAVASVLIPLVVVGRRDHGAASACVRSDAVSRSARPPSSPCWASRSRTSLASTAGRRFA